MTSFMFISDIAAMVAVSGFHVEDCFLGDDQQECSSASHYQSNSYNLNAMLSLSQPSMEATQKNTPIPRNEFTPAADAFSEASMVPQSSVLKTLETQGSNIEMKPQSCRR